MQLFVVVTKGTSSAISVKGAFLDAARAEQCLESFRSDYEADKLGIFTEDIDEKRISNSTIYVHSKYNSNEDSFFYGGIFAFKQSFRNENGIDYLIDTAVTE